MTTTGFTTRPTSNGQPDVWAEVSNNSFTVAPVGPELRAYLDQLTSYPTATAQAQSQGWRRRGAPAGEQYWDGMVRLARFHDGKMIIPTGLFQTVQTALAGTITPLHVRDLRSRPDDRIPDCLRQIKLRPYQERAVHLAMEAGRGVLDMPPRAGKTLTGLELQRRLNARCAWIAPTKNIISQTVRACDAALEPGHMVQLTGADWEHLAGTQIVAMTAATARMLPAEFWATREMLVIDEVHHAAAQTYHQLLAHCGHIYYRFGMSGTFRRSGNDELAMHAVLSNVVYKITAQELVQKGFLTEADVVFLPVNGPRARGGDSFQTGVGRSGLYQHDYRNQLSAWAAVTCWSRGLQVVVLVGTKEQGRTIAEICVEHVPKVPGAHWEAVEFVSTDRPSTVCEGAIASFVQRTGVQILIGTSMIGEGTDLPTCDALVYAPGGRAEVPHAQASYRVCTAAPGKARALIVDFADRHHSTLADHADDRLDTYLGQPIFHVQVLPEPEHLPWFLDSRRQHR